MMPFKIIHRLIFEHLIDNEAFDRCESVNRHLIKSILINRCGRSLIDDHRFHKDRVNFFQVLKLFFAVTRSLRLMTRGFFS